MSSKLYVYASEFRDAEVQVRLDLVRVVLNPSTRRRAHISLCGPYEQPLREEVVRDLDRSTRGVTLHIDGIGMFENAKERTVFLSCVPTRSLEVLWDKPQSSFSPHVTLYDGPDIPLAQELERRLSVVSPHFQLALAGIIEYQVGDTVPMDSPTYALGDAAARELALSGDLVQKITQSRRIELATIVLKELSEP